MTDVRKSCHSYWRFFELWKPIKKRVHFVKCWISMKCMTEENIVSSIHVTSVPIEQFFCYFDLKLALGAFRKFLDQSQFSTRVLLKDIKLLLLKMQNRYLPQKGWFRWSKNFHRRWFPVKNLNKKLVRLWIHETLISALNTINGIFSQLGITNGTIY